MTLVFLVYTGFLYGVFSYFFLRRQEKYLLVFLFRSLCVCIFFILPDKLAVVEISEVRASGLGHNFLLYYLLSFPVVELLNMPRAAMAAVSNSIIFVVAVYVVNSLPNLTRSQRVTRLCLLTLFPDVLYFSAFSVRDPAIAFISLLFVFVFFQSLQDKTRPKFSVIALCCVLLFSLRPELVIWMAMVVFSYFLFKRFSARSLGLIFLLGLFAIGLFVEFIIPPLIVYVGLVSESANLSGPEVWRFVVEARYFRQFGDTDGSGSTSAIIPPEIFLEISNFNLLALQMTSFIFITISQKSILIYFTIMSGAFLYISSIYKAISVKFHKNIGFLFMSGFLSFAIYAPFAVNGGNVFRVRLALIVIILSFLIMPLRRGRGSE